MAKAKGANKMPKPVVKTGKSRNGKPNKYANMSRPTGARLK